MRFATSLSPLSAQALFQHACLQHGLGHHAAVFTETHRIKTIIFFRIVRIQEILSYVHHSGIFVGHAHPSSNRIVSQLRLASSEFPFFTSSFHINLSSSTTPGPLYTLPYSPDAQSSPSPFFGAFLRYHLPYTSR